MFVLYCQSQLKTHADLAHLVERDLAKVEVAGSSPVIRSKKKDRFITVFFLSNPKDWYGITRRVYGIAARRMASHGGVYFSFGLIPFIIL